MASEQPAFICSVCAQVITVAHVPPTAPHCPGCGAATKPNAAMAAQVGDARCLHCGNIARVYAADRCPECDTVFGAFAPRARTV